MNMHGLDLSTTVNGCGRIFQARNCRFRKSTFVDMRRNEFFTDIRSARPGVRPFQLVRNPEDGDPASQLPIDYSGLVTAIDRYTFVQTNVC